jgi:ribosomal protein L37AE/L43A
MRSSQGENENQNVRVELKYCEHCGGLWVRECGAGVVYCDNCRPKVADLPLPKKKPGRTILPVAKPSLVEGALGDEADEREFEAAGGVA